MKKTFLALAVLFALSAPAFAQESDLTINDTPVATSSDEAPAAVAKETKQEVAKAHKATATKEVKAKKAHKAKAEKAKAKKTTSEEPATESTGTQTAE
ncbi:MAG: hypothetical protein PHW63_08060 [Alphaproteobacteria bacterium]|nr:hypothetical protein [Alphaproteobacteria bacterium]